MDDAINKTMDREDLFRSDCRRILVELFGLMRRMNRLDEAIIGASVSNSRSRPSADLIPTPRQHESDLISAQFGVPHDYTEKKSQAAGRTAHSQSTTLVLETESPPTTICDREFTELRPDKVAPLTYSSWYGRLAGWPGAWEHINRGMAYEPFPGNPDELKVPWFLLWEIAWLVANTPLKPGSRVLDMGGAGSLFSCYLASRGHEVITIDIDADLCNRADEIGRQMGWRMTGVEMDMAELNFPDEHFDHVFSVCVFEHLPVSGRVRCNEHIRRILSPGGTASYTFDYSNPQAFGRLATPDDVEAQFVHPSGLDWRGQHAFIDNGKRYLSCPQSFGFGRFTESAAKLHAFITGSMERKTLIADDTDYTFGALFLEKPMA